MFHKITKKSSLINYVGTGNAIEKLHEIALNKYRSSNIERENLLFGKYLNSRKAPLKRNTNHFARVFL